MNTKTREKSYFKVRDLLEEALNTLEEVQNDFDGRYVDGINPDDSPGLWAEYDMVGRIIAHLEDAHMDLWCESMRRMEHETN